MLQAATLLPNRRPGSYGVRALQQAEGGSGSTWLAWTNSRLRTFLRSARPSPTNAEIDAGTSQALRTWSAANVVRAVQSRINSFLPEPNPTQLEAGTAPTQTNYRWHIENLGRWVLRLFAPWAQVGNTDPIPAEKTGVDLPPPGSNLPPATEALYNSNAVLALAGLWYFIQLTGHEASADLWTWGDLNEGGHTDLAQWRGVVAENPFTISNPQVLDWSFITSERRWVRRNSSTWIYSSAPAQFEERYRSQHAAQSGGLVTVGKFIFVSSSHKMRIIRAYQGNIPGAPTYDWHVFTDTSPNIEPFALRDESIQVQPRKLAIFAQGDLNAIPDGGEQRFGLSMSGCIRVQTASLTSFDLSDWTPAAACWSWTGAVQRGEPGELFLWYGNGVRRRQRGNGCH